MHIRAISKQDYAQTGVVIEAAFGQKDEVRLVEKLRQLNNAIYELVAEDDGIVVGHILLSKLVSPERALALAPLSVRPARQNQGIGSALVRAALERAAADHWAAVFVLGEPAYYQRFGFSLAQATRFETVYPKDYMMVLALTAGILDTLSATLIYPQAFRD